MCATNVLEMPFYINLQTRLDMIGKIRFAKFSNHALQLANFVHSKFTCSPLDQKYQYISMIILMHKSHMAKVFFRRIQAINR